MLVCSSSSQSLDFRGAWAIYGLWALLWGRFVDIIKNSLEENCTESRVQDDAERLKNVFFCESSVSYITSACYFGESAKPVNQLLFIKIKNKYILQIIFSCWLKQVVEKCI